jgi:hypothetical protein
MKKCLFFLILILFINIISFAQGIQNIAGIGAQLILDTVGGYSMPRIFALVPNSPAYQSLNATDYIVKVDNVSCRNKTIEEVVALIRGEVGTNVKITTAPTKDGSHSKDTVLIRVGMQVPVANNAPQSPPNPPDPLTAFNDACENEAKQLKKTGVEVIKTYNSDCGNYFFNFNAETGKYRVRVITMEEKSVDPNSPAPGTTAKVYDGDNENGAVTLIKTGSSDKSSYTTTQFEGGISFNKPCVGVISITVHDDLKKCKGMYIIVYR